MPVLQRQARTTASFQRSYYASFLFSSRNPLLVLDVNVSKATTWLPPLVWKRSREVVFNFYFCRLIILIFQDSCVPLYGML